MSELSETAIVNHQFNVSPASLGQRDMVVCRDSANHMGSDTCGSDLTLKWPKMNAEIPCESSNMAEQECHCTQDPDSLQGKTDRMSQSLDTTQITHKETLMFHFLHLNDKFIHVTTHMTQHFNFTWFTQCASLKLWMMCEQKCSSIDCTFESFKRQTFLMMNG